MLTQRREDFCRNILKGMTQRDAWIHAGYSANSSIAVQDEHASKLAAKDIIKIRIQELRDMAATPDVMDYQERQEKLSCIGREDIISAKGTPLRAPNIASIQELNKMDKVYETQPLVDNRTINIIVSSEKAKELTEGIDKFGILNQGG